MHSFFFLIFTKQRRVEAFIARMEVPAVMQQPKPVVALQNTVERHAVMLMVNSN